MPNKNGGCNIWWVGVGKIRKCNKLEGSNKQGAGEKMITSNKQQVGVNN